MVEKTDHLLIGLSGRPRAFVSRVIALPRALAHVLPDTTDPPLPLGARVMTVGPAERGPAAASSGETPRPGHPNGELHA